MAEAKKLPSGQWRALVYSHTEVIIDKGAEKKKRIYESFTANTKKEANYLAAEFSLTKKEKIKRPDITLNQAVTNYCELKSNILSPATIREYKRMQSKCYEALLPLHLKEISTSTVQNWTNLFAANHSPKTVRNAHGLLSAVLEVYVPELQLNTTLPQKVTNQLYVPSDTDIKALLGYFAEHDRHMELAVYLAAFGTLRRSEVCALENTDVNGNIISVNKALVDSGASNWVIKTTKTVSSTRAIEMPDFVVKKFPDKGRLVPLNPDQVTHRFEKAIKDLKIHNFRYHDLRHYAASIMHAIGVPDQYIMQRGGWGSDKTLKAIYRGTIEEYTQKYTDLTLTHFDGMQHEIQHDTKKAL